MTDIVLYHYENGRATITLNRPDKRNALDASLTEAITRAVRQAEADKAKVLLLQANGSAFCAGADLAHMQRLTSFSAEENLADSRALKDMLYALWTSTCVVVAKVQGPAIAGGCGLASVCDFVLAADIALFGYPETRIGFLPAIVAVFGVQKFGTGKIGPYLISGKTFTALQAHELGLVQHVYAKQELDAATEAFCADLEAGCSRQSLADTKRLIRMAEGKGIEERLELACQMNVATRQTADFKTGIGAVLNKEKLVWKV
jgi:methylglutaconyl-CoA hydratase